MPTIQTPGPDCKGVVVTYLQVGNFEEVLGGVPKIGRAVQQAVKHENLVTLSGAKTTTQLSRDAQRAEHPVVLTG